MSEPNATPTRADVLREFSTPRVSHTSSGFHWDGKTWDEPTRESLADEIVRLRGQRDAIRKKLEAITDVVDDTTAAEIDAVLAALRDGGTDGQ